METGIELIAAERQKQIDKHGFTAEHHAVTNPQWYDQMQLQQMAFGLLSHESAFVPYDDPPVGWDAPWVANLHDRSRKERLIIAGALIAAELDRLNYRHNDLG